MACLTVLSISGLLLAITCFSLALFLVFIAKNKAQRLMLWYNMIVGIWGLGNFVFGLRYISQEEAALWWKIAHTGALYIPVVFFHLILEVCQIRRPKLLIFGYIQSTIFLILTWINRLGYRLDYVFDSFYYIRVTGPANVLMSILWFFYVIYGFYLMFKTYRAADGIRKMQVKYLMIAMFIGFFGGISHYYLAYGVKIYPFQGTIVVYMLIATYAILRHKLLDVEVIIKKTLVFAGLLASVFAMLILPTLIIQEYIFRAASFGGKMVGLAISGTVIILTMRRIETFLINVTDKYLFQKKYDYKELLKTFTSEVLTVLELDKLVNLTVDKLSDIIKLNSAAVLLFDDEKQQFEVMASHNIKDPSVTLIRPDGIVTFMEETHGYVLVKELRNKKIFVPASIEEIISKLNAELIIPMVMHEEVIGVLSLGKKKSDEDYSQDDLDILLPLAKTLAIAISNAELFVELGKTQAEAAQSEKMAVIGTLSAGINHEICNPLGIARGQCEAFLLNLKDGLYKAKTTEELLAKAKDIMAKVIHETDRATAITKKLSQFAKPAKGDAEPVNIDKEVDDVLGLVGYELKLEKIEIEKRLAPNLPEIFVDRKQFQEVLFNLIRNAGQAIGEKGKINIIAREERGKVFIDIQDTGSGIPEDKIKQLFNPFFTTKDPGKGTGLGLFIVRQVIEKNGGRIYLKETKVGEGTTFTLEFPVAQAKIAQKK